AEGGKDWIGLTINHPLLTSYLSTSSPKFSFTFLLIFLSVSIRCHHICRPFTAALYPLYKVLSGNYSCSFPVISYNKKERAGVVNLLAHSVF
ncbi:hypothetical protein LJC56_11240, partial [Christensenellaceae bacterium OttesenSCG-928-K19]|nr:hypothetical protein [Christensenellaceae bacterium OttesenSCG-928-K19]